MKYILTHLIFALLGEQNSANSRSYTHAIAQAPLLPTKPMAQTQLPGVQIAVMMVCRLIW
jgi:hypothetical protein